MESLNGRIHLVYVIYKDLSMLTGQTGLPPNQPIDLKVKNVHNFDIFQPIWLKLSIVSKWKDSTDVCDLKRFHHANQPNRPTTQLAYQPKSEKCL